MTQAFRFPYVIGLHDTDAAGVIFSANIIRIGHHAYEAMMESIGFGLGRLLKERTLGLPIVHIEADFVKYLTVGDRTEIHLRVAEVGRTSYRVEYEIFSAAGDLCARAATVHVCVDPRTGYPMDVPAEFRAALAAVLASDKAVS